MVNLEEIFIEICTSNFLSSYQFLTLSIMQFSTPS